jgi:hypothetical protein
MGRKKLQPGHNPESYHCQNPKCERTTPLTLDGYGMYPSQDVPEDRIHRVWEPQMPGFSFMCPSCAHFTVVTRHDPK